MKKSLRLILSVMAITILSQGSLLAWSEPTQITTGGTAPSLIQDFSEKYWVAFSYGGDVYMANSPDGITWGTPTKITNWGNCSLSTLIQDAGGIYRLAFGAGSAEPYKIYVMSSFDGVNWSSPVQVPTAGTSFEPCIIQDSNGKYWLTYNTYWGIYITSSDDFVNWGSSTNIVSGFMAGSWLIQDSAGKYWVAYYYHGGNWPVYITSSSNGTSWDSPIEIVSGQDDGYYNARNPELIQDSTGTYWMTYGTVDQGDKHDIALISSLDGVSWGSPVIVAGGDSDDGYTSSIIQDVSGMYWVVFPSDRSGAWNLWITSITAQEIGLFAYWKFDEGSGFIAGDSSGNGKDGIIDGATWTTGKIGDALSFDGFDDWVDVPDDISPEHITLEAWIYPTGFDDGPGDQGNAIIQRSTGGAGAPGDRSWSWRLRIMPRSHLAQFQAAGPNTGVGSVVAPTALVQNRWYHLAATYDGNVMKIYVDGELKATNSNLDGPLETYHLIPVAIGCLEGWGLQHFQGIIDEVRVYGRALASEEVAQHAECGPAGISGLVTDGNNHPLVGAEVFLWNLTSPWLSTFTITNPEGKYSFNSNLPSGFYQLQASLKYRNMLTGDVIFQVHHGAPGVSPTSPVGYVLTGAFPVLTSESIKVDLDFGDISLETDPDITPKQRLIDLAHIYHYSTQVIDFDFNILGVTLDLDLPIDIYAYNPDWWFTPWKNEADAVFYNPADNEIFIGENFSWFQNGEAPMNREWHELFHELMDDTIGLPLRPLFDSSHGGYANSSTCDSWGEGWAEFWSCVLWGSIGLENPNFYRMSLTPPWKDFERNWKAWEYEGDRPREEFAIASLLWDLFDEERPFEGDFLHLSIEQIWSVIRNEETTLYDMKDVYDALVLADIGNDDTNGDNITDLDEVFISHGFFVDLDSDRVYDYGEEVGRAADGNRQWRRNTPKVSGANILISVVDNQGNPISNGTFVSEVSYAPPEDYLNYVAEVPLPETTDYLAYFTPPPLGSSATITVYIIKDSDGMKTDKLIIDNSVYWENYERRAEDYVFEHIFTIGASEKRTILASVDLKPDVLNLKSKGRRITCYIELPDAYDVTDINVSTVSLNRAVFAERQPAEIGDYDNDGVQDLMVKFDRSKVNSMLSAGEKVRISIDGLLVDGEIFEGIEIIKVMSP